PIPVKERMALTDLPETASTFRLPCWVSDKYMGNDATPTIEVFAGACHGPTSLSIVVITPAIPPLGGNMFTSFSTYRIIALYVALALINALLFCATVKGVPAG